jgi:hypothetical protein
MAIASCVNLTRTALLGEPVQFTLCSCLLSWPPSAVVDVVIVSSFLDGHIGLPWTAGGKVKNLDLAGHAPHVAHDRVPRGSRKTRQEPSVAFAFD